MSSAAFGVLRKVTTATITTMLLEKGIRRCWMHGPKPLVTGEPRLIGPALTSRFVPAREDLATPESWGKPISTRATIEAMPEGVIAVADARGVETPAFSATSCAPARVSATSRRWSPTARLRDRTDVLASGLPVWCAGMAAPAPVRGAGWP
jgi:regulator of RNase E activity RraA